MKQRWEGFSGSVSRRRGLGLHATNTGVSLRRGFQKRILLRVIKNQENEFYSSQGFLVSDPNPAQQMPVNG
jgi:hypothetical protein